ncbi:cation diffusion facilitator family transporter [Oleiagrimonas sp. C23AA]|uniref:cation diffusion facilitator family transporter n=1 Tax=Oleiagrimonas sp. C23AA TaxID=2719047 RepID=UPI00141E7386|nr:cation diffusion facilitator family transporter [Oleiagrimonas sp. C23AA]NII10192.1 cation transporter [Oleiagrimonas sp. C23AA]
MASHSHSHHHHGHDHHGHGHAHGSERQLLFAFVLTSLMLFVEAGGGFWSGSLALLADAGHMLVDAAALLLAYMSAKFARRPADERRTFGYARMEVLAGYSNALVQFILVAWIAVEAIIRFFQPTQILSGIMLSVAIFGLVVNALVLRVLHHHDEDDVNIAGASLHVLGDLLGSVGAVLAALAVRWLDWNWADPALSLLVSLLILRSAWHLLRRSGHILLEGVPDGLETPEMARTLADADAGIEGVHHLHVWQLASGSRMATLHAHLNEGADERTAMLAIKKVLADRYQVRHVTVQVDPGRCLDTHAQCASGGSH